MGTSVRSGRRRRSWPEAIKREIVAASLAPGASVSVVARQYDVNANQVDTLKNAEFFRCWRAAWERLSR